MALYNGTQGENWINNSGWNTSSPVCTWYGVTCDSADHVTSLVLENNHLIGTLPPGIGDLIYLTTLKITGNKPTCDVFRCYEDKLGGPIPAEIGKLVNLQSLDLGSNSLYGPVPPEIGNLVNLQSLILSDNGLSESIPAEIGKLVNLQSLILNDNHLSESIPAEIGNLVNLQSLILFNNGLSGTVPAEFGNLMSLQSLDLHWNQTNINPPGNWQPGEFAIIRPVQQPIDIHSPGDRQSGEFAVTELEK